MKHEDKFKELVLEHAESLKDIFIEKLIGSEDSFYQDKHVNLKSFQEARIADINRQVAKINQGLNATGVSLSVTGLVLQDPKKNNEFSYRPQFEIKSSDTSIHFDNGRFFEKMIVKNSQEDLLTLMPRYEEHKKDLSNDNILAFKSLMLVVKQEVLNVCEPTQENKETMTKIDKEAVGARMKKMFDTHIDTPNVGLYQNKSSGNTLGLR